MGTTSGVADFVTPRDKLIKRALSLLGAIASGEPPAPGSSEVDDAAGAVNAMVKEWDAIGIHVWTEFEGMLFLAPGQALYRLGGTTTDHAVAQESWTQRSVLTTSAAATTALPVDTSSGLTVG